MTYATAAGGEAGHGITEQVVGTQSTEDHDAHPLAGAEGNFWTKHFRCFHLFTSLGFLLNGFRIYHTTLYLAPSVNYLSEDLLPLLSIVFGRD